MPDLYQGWPSPLERYSLPLEWEDGRTQTEDTEDIGPGAAEEGKLMLSK